jgi:hypothetical protein
MFDATASIDQTNISKNEVRTVTLTSFICLFKQVRQRRVV